MRRLVAMLALAAIITLLGAPAALAEPARSVTIEDTQGVLHPAPLEERLEKEVSFRKDVDLVLLTLDVTEQGYSSSSDLALNDAVLAYARAERPEWLTDGGAYWRDGLVILAVDPGNRFLGTYAGEDVKLTQEQYTAIQNAMKTPARDGDWDGTMVTGATEYADLLARPWYLEPGFFAAVAAGVLALLAAIGTALGIGRVARGRVRRALPRYDDVMLNYAATELAAKTIPADSRYGEPVLRDYETFRDQAAEATRLREQIPEHRGLLWGIRPRTYTLARDFLARTEHVDAADDEIVRTNDLLNRGSSWFEAWQLEARPVRDSLRQVDAAIRQAPEFADGRTAQDLREVAGKVDAGLEATTRKLQDGTMSPDDALAELDLMTNSLAKASTAHRDLVIAAMARTEREAQIMRDAGSSDTWEGSYRSIRSRRHHYYPGSYALGWSLSPILTLNSWGSSATTALESHRNPPSSSSGGGGSFSGYSGGGGGFSGSGSSSRF